MPKINLAEKFAKISEYWKPYVAAELNGQHVKLDKLKGEFIFHHHENEDELFLVVKGRFRMEFSDRLGKDQRRVDRGRRVHCRPPRRGASSSGGGRMLDSTV
jgi:hypothetical protein